MKKVIALAVLLLVVAVAGAYVYYYEPFSPEKSIESVLPHETLAMVRVDNIEENIQRFREGRLGKAIENLDMEKILSITGASAEEIQEAKRKRDAFLEALESTWFDALFSETAVMAFLPMDTAELSPENPKVLAKSMVLVSRTRHPAMLVSSLSRMFAEELDVQIEKHGEWEISRFELESDDPVYFVTRGKLLFMAPAPEPLAACLSVEAGDRKSLASHPQFLAIKSELFDAPNLQISGFCNAIASMNLITDVAKALGASEKDLTAIDQNLSGFKSGGFAAYDDASDMLHKKFCFFLDKERMIPVVAKALGTPPDLNRTLGLMPGEPLIFNWQNLYDLRSYWDIVQVKGGLTKKDRMQVEASVEENLGVGFEELMETFGNQFGFVLNDVLTNGIFPLPELAIIGEVKREAVIDRMMSTIAGNAGLQIQEDNHHGTQIRYAVIPFAVGVTPAYACKDSFCMLTTNRKLIKAMLSASESPEPRIKENTALKSVDKGLTDKNNQVLFIRFAPLIDKLHEIIDWGATFAAMADPGSAETTQDRITHIVNPLLEGLKMYETIGMRSQSFNGGEKIQTDVWVRINRMPEKASQ